MKSITLGKTGITVLQNAFGALPIQRVSEEMAVKLLRMAYDGGMRFFDTARAYSDSEEKLGAAFPGYVKREDIYIATKTEAGTVNEVNAELEISLKNLKTDYVDIYQLHCVDRCYKPGDGSGMYENLLRLKKEGKIRHIGITTHKIAVAEEIAESGLYETLQFPFSYLASDRDIKLVKLCEKNNVGFIAMKSLAGGLITNYKAAYAYASQFEVLPIWGVQKEQEVMQWLSLFHEEVTMTDEIRAEIEKDRKELAGDFCRGCGYCMPCPVGITINQCARMSLMIRRAPSKGWLGDEWQAQMQKIKDCRKCGLCASKCPYGLDTPNLLVKNLADYESVLAGKTKVD